MGRRIIAVVVAAALALLGAVLVYTYASNADQRALRDQQPRAVYVTTAVVPAGTTLKAAISSGLVKKTKVPENALPVGALASVNAKNSALIAVNDISPGQAVLAAAFGREKLGTKALTPDAGNLAVSVTLSDPARVGRFVTLGTHITVFQTYKERFIAPQGATKEEQDHAEKCNQLDLRRTSVLLPDVKVIGVGDTALSGASASNDDGSDDSGRSSSQSSGASFLVTLQVTPDQSVDLVQAINNYTVYAGLLGDDVTVSPDLRSTIQSACEEK